MAMTEQDRRRLYERLEETLGEDPAATLMGYLPPVGWADVATRHDLDDLRAATRKDLEHLKEWAELRFDSMATREELATLTIKVANFRAEMHKALRAQFLALVTVFITAAVALSRLPR